MGKRPESYVGTYANRFIHYPSDQLIIGPYVIDADRRVRTIRDRWEVRLCATMAHPKAPKHRVYMLGMEGEFFEMDARTLAVRQQADLCRELAIPKGRWPHFKAGYSAFGQVVVASNTYAEEDFQGAKCAGRIAEWDGRC